MRLSSKKILLIGVVATILIFAIYYIFSIKNSALKTLAEERARLLELNRVPFEKKNLTPHLSQKIKIIQNTDFTTDLVRFRDSYFASTNGGLAQYDDAGNLLKHYTVLDGLPESDLTALTVFQDKLFIGTRTKSLVVFDGEKFANYIFPKRNIQAVTVLFSTISGILIGTTKGGLIEFDGVNFTEIKAAEKTISAINCLQILGEKLFVGTFDNGLWVRQSGIWTHYKTTENLPSNRVVGIFSQNEKIYVATDFGLAELQENSARQISVLPAISSAIRHKNKTYLTKDNGKIFTFDDLPRDFSATENLQNARLVSVEEKLFLLSKQGIYSIAGTKIKPFSHTENISLTDNFVSASALDTHGNLWVGTFRNGIDVFSENGKKLKHLESEQLREINFLQAENNIVSVATSRGLQTVKENFSVVNLTKNEGLPSNSVTHFSGDFLATAKGLAIRRNEKISVLSAVQGLPNNSVYTTLQTGKKLYAGTLGGLAEIENNRVVQIYKDSNSNLRTNWVTALITTNERVFIGTYGGGIFELLPSGEIRSFESETGKFVVNPNAFLSDGERLFAGTLTGIKILNLRTQEWKTVKEILPSETVMSIVGDAEKIYFGTTNGFAIVEKNYFE